jgi:hypothetical protein
MVMNFDWLTIRSECFSEQDVRSIFEKYGGLTDCDGALGGPEDGWVMVGMASEDAARSAVQALKASAHVVGTQFCFLSKYYRYRHFPDQNLLVKDYGLYRYRY